MNYVELEASMTILSWLLFMVPIVGVMNIFFFITTQRPFTWREWWNLFIYVLLVVGLPLFAILSLEGVL